MAPDDVFNDAVIDLNRLLLAAQIQETKALMIATLEEAQILCKIIIYRLTTQDGPEARINEENFRKQYHAITAKLRRLREE
jgi:hypothetical protein